MERIDKKSGGETKMKQYIPNRVIITPNAKGKPITKEIVAKIQKFNPIVEVIYSQNQGPKLPKGLSKPERSTYLDETLVLCIPPESALFIDEVPSAVILLENIGINCYSLWVGYTLWTAVSVDTELFYEQIVQIDQILRSDVISIIDKLYSKFDLDRSSDNIALQVVKTIMYDYMTQNCGLGFIFKEKVIPYLKKLNENERLQEVKNLLTDGYIDIKNERIHMKFMPYLNYDKEKQESIMYYITSINQE